MLDVVPAVPTLRAFQAETPRSSSRIIIIIIMTILTKSYC